MANVNAWLERAGIILNFLAGFLIAPELIGLDRVKNGKKRSKIYFLGLNQLFGDRIQKIKKNYYYL